MKRSLQAGSRKSLIAIGAVALFVLAGCATDRNLPGAPAFARTCGAQSGAQTATESPRGDFFAEHYGCVNQANLRAMVDNPADLETGRPLGLASGERESLGVDAYNRGKVESPKSTGGATPTIVMPAAVGGGAQ